MSLPSPAASAPAVPPGSAADPLDRFAPPVAAWFRRALGEPTPPQAAAWAPIGRGESTLLLSPTGSGKTLAAFLWCLQRLMFAPAPQARARCRVLYVSPLKALAVDVERNLRAPLVGIANEAALQGVELHMPTVAIRTGDTPPTERAQFQRRPTDILVTTPESLYLMLTSKAREVLASVDTVIVDEIHALAPTKRGSHLALSLERLEQIVKRGGGRPLQRIGLSATQRPLDEVARFLGGYAPGAGAGDELEPRPVTIVDVGARKALEVQVVVPLEDMTDLNEVVEKVEVVEIPSGPAAQGPRRSSIWDAIHPSLLALVQAHRSTIVFTNSRRLAERLAGALNELAGEPLVRAHHGSLAREQRAVVEDALKCGQLRGIVATSSLELGIDMGAVDLVVMVESPPSVASGLQRVGRASHQVGATSKGVLFPKFRADLVTCAALVASMYAGRVEATRYPRNPVDVLAQQVVAAVAMDDWSVDELFALVRRAAPFAGLTRASFEAVLDMLSGRYASDAFAELRPRITWDRGADTLAARRGAQRVAVSNPGTIPDRGLYPVYLAGDEGEGTSTGAGSASARRARSRRVGELDEEMVFETVRGDTIILGASTWRVEEITHDRVTVSPAPGEPGRMPFWRGERAGRPVEFGRSIGAMLRELAALGPAAAESRLTSEHGLDPRAARNLIAYMADQREVGSAVPDDRTVVVERGRDELGDWRICVLTPLGGKVIAPWAMAAARKVRDALGFDPELSWTDDGFVLRLPESEAPPPLELFVPDPDEVEALVTDQLGATAMFAARFREAAGRALLLPRRSPQRRAPLWMQRKRSADLLAVASRHPSFPIILECYRECLVDLFDMPALVDLLRDLRARRLQVREVNLDRPSPFASAILFGFAAEFLYDGDAPLAERRAQALTIDHERLRELMGELELRELLEPEVISAVELQLQGLERERPLPGADAVHDLLLRLGELSRAELTARAGGGDAGPPPPLEAWVDALVLQRRLLELAVGGERRLVPVEYGARYRDALGVVLPAGLPEALLEPPADALGDLVRRFARTRGPFTPADLGARYGAAPRTFAPVLARLEAEGELVRGAFRRDHSDEEWCNAEVLGQIRQRSLARVRRQVEPVAPAVLAESLRIWQGVDAGRQGADALLDAIEKLQGAPVPASVLESEILPARVEGYTSAMLDLLLGAGEVVWHGHAPLGHRDGRISLYLTDDAPLLRPVPHRDELGELGEREQRIFAHLEQRGPAFASELYRVGGGLPHDAEEALWNLAWRGFVTNHGFAPVRTLIWGGGGSRGFRSRRRGPVDGGGRWSVVPRPELEPTLRLERVTRQLLERHGVLTRELTAAEGVPGGFPPIYSALRAMEDAGRIRRGYFVQGVSTLQFAQPAMLDLLRATRGQLSEADEGTAATLLAATDPANPFGALLPWPEGLAPGRHFRRSAGAAVLIVGGELVAYLARSRDKLWMTRMDDEHRRAHAWAGAATCLAGGDPGRRQRSRRGAHMVQLAEIDGEPAADHPFAAALAEAGFRRFGDLLRGPVPELEA